MTADTELQPQHHKIKAVHTQLVPSEPDPLDRPHADRLTQTIGGQIAMSIAGAARLEYLR